MTDALLLIGAGVIIAAGLFVAIGAPLLRGADPAPVDSRATFLKIRLAEIERQRASTLLGDGEAGEAVTEAQRAALSESAETASSIARKSRLAAIAFLALAPAAAAFIYLKVGAPALLLERPEVSPIDAAAVAAMPEAERQAMIESMVASLAARLEEQPDDPEGWRMLARSQLVLRRPVDSAASYRRLLSMEEGTLDDWRNFALARAAAEPAGRLPADDEFMRALDEIDTRAPGDAMALFWRGGAASERGDAETAVALWSKLLAMLPAEAPIRPTLQALIDKAGAETGAENAPE